jgi:pimeloyl-ACP methyl ester carboxylesterase
VLGHGLVMDGRLWRDVVTELGESYRCVLPTLPLGAHRHRMHADADLSLRGLGRLVAEFLDRLDLRDVTLCFNDWAERRRWWPTLVEPRGPAGPGLVRGV